MPATLKEGLDAAADEMRRLMIEDSKRFAGITDGKTTLSNARGQSEGLDVDQFKLRGTRLDIDALCGPDNRRCESNDDGTLKLNEKGQILFDGDKAETTLAVFLSSAEGKELVRPHWRHPRLQGDALWNSLRNRHLAGQTDRGVCRHA